MFPYNSISGFIRSNALTKWAAGLALAAIPAISQGAPSRDDHRPSARQTVEYRNHRGDDHRFETRRPEPRRDWGRHDYDRRDRTGFNFDLRIGEPFPRYETREVRVWVPPVYRTECVQVWVPDYFEDREVRYVDHGRWCTRIDRVLVTPGHYESRDQQILVSDGHYETHLERVRVG